MAVTCIIYDGVPVAIIFLLALAVYLLIILCCFRDYIPATEILIKVVSSYISKSLVRSILWSGLGLVIMVGSIVFALSIGGKLFVIGTYAFLLFCTLLFSIQVYW